MKKRNRRLRSIQTELLNKSREAALTAVQIFNNPQVKFKSELFIVTICIAWTYLMHAYFRKKGIEYRYFGLVKNRRVFDKTKGGAYKHWELERCLTDAQSPVDKNASNNLLFFIGLRHEIEHQMTMRIDNSLSAKFQACCLNFNTYIKQLFGENFGIDKYLSFSLQFSSINPDQVDLLSLQSDLPHHIETFVKEFEGELTEAEFNHPQYAYRVLFVPKTANRKGQADKVIEFVKADSELAGKINTTYALIKETERQKYLPSEIVAKVKKVFPKFSMYAHTVLWQERDARNLTKGYGVKVSKTWYWYDRWLKETITYCEANKEKFS